MVTSLGSPIRNPTAVCVCMCVCGGEGGRGGGEGGKGGPVCDPLEVYQFLKQFKCISLIN